MECLGSICLLQKSTISDVFHFFLQQRRTRILQLIDSSTIDVFDSVMEHLPELFYSTLDITTKLFLDSEKKSRFHNFMETIQEQGLGQTSLLFSENTNFNL